jgi:sucrose synthase
MTATKIADFLESCADDPDRWQAMSRAGVARVESRYTWEIHARRLMTLARVYGFWRYVNDLERAETDRYLQSLYNLALRPRALAMENHGG